MEGRRSLSKRNQASASERDEILREKKGKQTSASEGGEIQGKQTSASEGGEILRGKKAKQASASEGGEILMTEKGNQAGASEGGEILMKEKGNQAGASEGVKILRTEKENQSSASIKVGEVLRRKREMWMSYEFSEDIELLVTRLNPAQAVSGETTTKRKTKIVQKEVPKEVIEDMIKTPHPIIGELLTDDQLAETTDTFREAYARYKVRSVKVRAYYQALIDQYNAHGKAFDEEEITDNEEEITDNEEEVTDDEELVES